MLNTTRTESIDRGVRIYRDDTHELRVVYAENGTPLYCAIDIAALMGYVTPSKVVTRTTFEKYKAVVPWESENKVGIAKTWCFTKESAIKFMRTGKPCDGLIAWFTNEVVPIAEKTVHTAPEKETSQSPTKGATEAPKVSQDHIQQLIAKLDRIILDAVLVKSELMNA